jgi:hypothetical protein
MVIGRLSCACCYIGYCMKQLDERYLLWWVFENLDAKTIQALRNVVVEYDPEEKFQWVNQAMNQRLDAYDETIER